MIISFDSPSLTTVLCDRTGCRVLQMGGGGFWRQFSRVPLYLLLDCFHFPLSVLVGGTQEWFNIHPSTQCALRVNAIHFLFSLNAFSYGALGEIGFPSSWIAGRICICITWHDVNMICANLSVWRKSCFVPYLWLNEKNESGNHMPNVRWRGCWLGYCLAAFLPWA